MSQPRPTRRRLARLGAVLAPLTAVALVLAGHAFGAAGDEPSMEVTPSTTGLHYSQTVTIKAHNLPKGSGNTAATICGLEDADGAAIAEPGADDCAGAAELGTLVVLKKWDESGEFETQYTLPDSGQKFGENDRFCDATHHCALVVADANPNAPAYHVDQVIQFDDQQPYGGSTSGTTVAPSDGSTPPTTNANGNDDGDGSGNENDNGNGGGDDAQPAPGITGTGDGDADLDPNHPRAHFEFEFGVHPPEGGAPALPVPPAPPAPPAPPSLPPEVTQAIGEVCSQLTAAVTQAGGDAAPLATACAAAQSGDPSQARAVLQAPNLLCIAAAPAWQSDPQVTAACTQAATALAPATQAVDNTLSPVFG
jgi:hypothetical protein